MKKCINKILLLVLVLSISISAAGCSLFFDPDYDGGERNPPPVESNYTVEFNTKAEEDRDYNRLAAINEVKRANVAIMMQSGSSIAYGSGVIVDINLLDEDNQRVDSENEFYILTCYHVVSSCGEISVYLPDKNSRNFNDEDYDDSFAFSGVIDNEIHNDNAITLVGGDSFTDIAVLKLDISGTDVTSEDIVEAHMPSSEYTHSYGEEVFAIGNPGGTMPMSVSDGIISYLERTMNFEGTELTVMQITAHATHGNSGGGVYNLYGELIGLVNGGSDVYLTRNAIPFKNLYSSEDTGLVSIATKLIESKTQTNYGYVPGRWNFGITVEERTLSGSSALIVSHVNPDSNAEKSGFLVDDILTSVVYFNGEDTVTVNVTTNSSFALIISDLRNNYGMGGSFKVNVKRMDALTWVDVQLTFNITEQFIFCDTGA